MSKRALFLAPLLLSLAACAGTTKVMLSSPRPPVDPATVRIYTAVPPGAVQIAQLEAQSAVGFGTQGQTDAAMRRLKNEAAKLGANGVVLIGAGAGGRSPVGLSVGGGSYGGHVGGGIGIGIPTQQKQANGVAIYVPPGAERAAETAPATP
ncbi:MULTISPECIES: hypothetical protein [Pseudoxanthomonas]|uniref:Lipoprotein n=1 Tax=Pseudoxanthomonas winnipegensis TaxID=2480810 RepID=A0AAW8GFX3_9GAMM|nr:MULTISPECIES: hypothetical protein [Pseudoxanthomonas]MDQ1121093.1 hypothetical protein [Pseudoxanthomonas winnipegensis]MDQ1134325.1 hypothetical protein [Pseudoxanthomonas winnipegensis]MDR6139444.1 hypothetical protein [Pseudoxanthomonas sp. SORGH_AS_0997]